MKPTIVLVGDGSHDGVRALVSDQYRLLAVNTVSAALEAVSRERACVVLIDQRNGTRFDENTVRQLKAAHPDLGIICIGAGEDWKTEQVSPTVYRVRLAGSTEEVLLGWIDRMAEVRRSASEERPRWEMVGRSPAMMNVRRTIDKVADRMCPVLISGEYGTGKELVARALHSRSCRPQHLFIGVNCAAVPRELLENELFGHEKGSYTGADSRKVGRFERAGRGTILLDEIGDMPLPLQVKLLRVLQEREFERVGGGETVKLEARVVAATNQDLKSAIANGTFRADLHSRLEVVEINVPPLRDREGDLPLLVDHFVEKYRADSDSADGIVVTPEAMEMLAKHAFRDGNVRELEHKIWRAVCMCERGTITPKDLLLDGEGARSPSPLVTLNRKVGKMALPEAVAAVETQMIEDALRMVNGVKAKAAKLLVISERMLSYKMKKYGIKAHR